jgi:hypothetical protein
MQTVLNASAAIPLQHPTTAQVIAESIRRELAEARACDDSVNEAEKRVSEMLMKFPDVTVIAPFRIHDRTNFGEWTVEVRNPIGSPSTIDQNS